MRRNSGKLSDVLSIHPHPEGRLAQHPNFFWILKLPSRELTYPTFQKEHHLQNCLERGYVGSQESMYMTHCCWFTNPAKQLRLVVYPIIHRVLYIQTVVVWDFFHQQYLVCTLVYKLIQQIQVDPIKVDGAELSSRLTSDCQLVGSPD